MSLPNVEVGFQVNVLSSGCSRIGVFECSFIGGYRDSQLFRFVVNHAKEGRR